MIFYFSGTGNSEYVAKQLAARLGDRLVKMGDAVAHADYDYTLSEGERVGWVFPVYSWGPAPIAVEFASKVVLHGYGCNTYSYMVATCGDEVGEAVAMWRKALRGIECQAAFSVQMPNNYILLPGFDVDSKSVENAKRDAAPKRIDEIMAAVKSGSCVCDVMVGSMPRLKSRLVYPLFRRFYMSDKGFKVDRGKCTHCGLCSKVCPVGNVKMSEDATPQWDGRCEMCLSCIHRCPARAIEYSKVTRNKGRYHF